MDELPPPGAEQSVPANPKKPENTHKSGTLPVPKDIGIPDWLKKDVGDEDS